MANICYCRSCEQIYLSDKPHICIDTLKMAKKAGYTEALGDLVGKLKAIDDNGFASYTLELVEEKCEELKNDNK